MDPKPQKGYLNGMAEAEWKRVCVSVGPFLVTCGDDSLLDPHPLIHGSSPSCKHALSPCSLFPLSLFGIINVYPSEEAGKELILFNVCSDTRTNMSLPIIDITVMSDSLSLTCPLIKYFLNITNY